ncbi:MAG: hypothetical protein ACR2PK_01305 [Acidimicrobiales bacterium]
MGSWRSGYSMSRRAGWAPAGAVVVGVIGLVFNIVRHDGDIRAGIFPWSMTVVVLAFAACALAVLHAHWPQPSRWVIVGAWWTAAALVSMGIAFASIGVGAIFDVDEEELGAAAIFLVLVMAFGLVSMTPALAVLAIGMEREKRLRWWGRLNAWIAAPVLPLLLIFGGLFEDTVETVGSAVLIGTFGAAWVALGLAVAMAMPPTTKEPPT